MKMDEDGRRKKQVNVDGNALLLGAGLELESWIFESLFQRWMLKAP